MINKIKQEKGITIISLVITVMIMAILIGIVLKVSTDDDIIGTTQNATDKYQNALVSQAINSAFVSGRSLYEDGFITENEMWDNIKTSLQNNQDLKQYGTIEVTEKTNGTGLEVKIGIYSYSITKDGVEEL